MPLNLNICTASNSELQDRAENFVKYRKFISYLSVYINYHVLMAFIEINNEGPGKNAKGKFYFLLFDESETLSINSTVI